MKTVHHRRIDTARRGSALVVSLLMLIILGGMAAALASLNGTLHNEHQRVREETRSFYMAEAGLNEAYAHLKEVGEDDVKAMTYPVPFDHGSYTVETIFGKDDPVLRLDRLRMRAAGTAGVRPAGVELTIWKVPTGFFRWAIFGDKWVNLDSNSLIDSYDSKDGPYPDNVPYVNDFGNVGSNGNINIDANTDVYGDTIAGPMGYVDDGDPGVTVAGMISSATVPEDFPPINVPVIPLTGSGSLSVNGNVTLAAGDYHYSALTVHGGGQFVVQGPARLVVDDLAVLSNAEWVIDATNGPIEVYGTGNFDLRSNSTITTTSYRSRDVSLLLTGQNFVNPKDVIAFNSNSDFTGTIYAPNALVNFDSNFSVFGAVKAGAVDLDSNSQVHFDEDLLYDPNVPFVYERVAWRKLSAKEVSDLGF